MFLNKVMQTYHSKKYFRPELSRAKLILSRVFKAQQNLEGSIEAMEEAKRLRDELLPDRQIPLDDLRDNHFDELVMFLKV